MRTGRPHRRTARLAGCAVEVGVAVCAAAAARALHIADPSRWRSRATGRRCHAQPGTQRACRAEAAAEVESGDVPAVASGIERLAALLQLELEQQHCEDEHRR